MPGTDDEPLLVADSWLVLDGAVRAMQRHVDRFTRSCLALGVVTTVELQEFWSAAVAGLPRSGAWFPRAELVASGLQLRMRPAPVRGDSVQVWVPDKPDRRIHPDRKGPDIEALGQLRKEAEHHGAQEALLMTPDGVVVEASSSSVLWWEDDVLCAPPEGIPALPGITATLVWELAVELGIPTDRRARRPAELSGKEVWLLNALHGVRLVTGWAEDAITPGAGTRFSEWRERVEQSRVRLGGL
ncbi:branched-subunit amino acid aminotransferase/4-amino-4-deoxychorismate lyase [Kibdelosporangium banguiense]|uniref:Branched-subunit amino acid aminotransferase/4-amino-4-deoxychorismate lyase n=1 Tax=Kibdelosporangium banguiense TaxID=1365924 RepID=A0ABS4TZ49_9PSEU|nr:aminotransferase class IV [Kibdelosporangium banguiense]MBP2329687.1 branched-subunit amino acid aminotransferase/4-amino-4-deoxychorismate lyase [Kibdelosporangium banguiense]